jgi:hypothetical protein
LIDREAGLDEAAVWLLAEARRVNLESVFAKTNHVVRTCLANYPNPMKG